MRDAHHDLPKPAEALNALAEGVSPTEVQETPIQFGERWVGQVSTYRLLGCRSARSRLTPYACVSQTPGESLVGDAGGLRKVPDDEATPDASLLSPARMTSSHFATVARMGTLSPISANGLTPQYIAHPMAIPYGVRYVFS